MPKDETTIDNTVDESGTPPEGATTDTASETQPKPKSEKPAQVTYTEAEYKGLQAVIAKRDETIKRLTEEKAEVLKEKTELENNHGKVASEKSTLDSELKQFKEKASTLEKERAELQKKLSYQEIVMKEFPDLSTAASLIPSAETEEAFRENAKQLQQVLKEYSNNKVKDVLSGSSPPVTQSDAETVYGEDDLDRAWRDVSELAGNAEKRDEYLKARDKYEQVLDSRQTN